MRSVFERVARASLRPIASRFGYETLDRVPLGGTERVCLTPIVETDGNDPRRWMEALERASYVAMKIRTVHRPERVVDAARGRSQRVWIDAEDVDQTPIERAWMDAHLKRVTSNEPPYVVETVACYRRDAYDHVRERIRYVRMHKKKHAVKLVKGAYRRRPTVHWMRKHETDACFRACLDALAKDDVPIDVVAASHDPRMIAHAIEKIPSSRLEVAYLKGVQPSFVREQLRSTHPDVPVVMYAPIGSIEEVLPYLMRRGMESPHILRRSIRDAWTHFFVSMQTWK